MSDQHAEKVRLAWGHQRLDGGLEISYSIDVLAEALAPAETLWQALRDVLDEHGCGCWRCVRGWDALEEFDHGSSEAAQPGAGGAVEPTKHSDGDKERSGDA